MSPAQKSRYESVQRFIQDPTVAYPDKLRVAYHAIRFEIVNAKMERLDKIAERHFNAVKTELDVRKFNKQLQDL